MLSNLYAFLDRKERGGIWGLDLCEQPHREIIEAIQEAELNDANPSVMVIVPRGTYKTSIARGAIVWKLLRQVFLFDNPYHRIAMGSATLRLGRETLAVIKNQLRYNKELIAAYGPMWQERSRQSDGSKVEDGIVLKPRLDRGEIASCPEPNLWIASERKVSTGAHCDELYVDDLHDEKSVKTQERIEKVHDVWRLLQPLLNPTDRVGRPARRTVTATRWHDNDVPGLIKRTMEENRKSDWVIIQRGAFTEVGAEEGPLYFPSVLSEAILDDRKRDLGPGLFCTPGDAGIMMADLTDKRISDVEIGDVVVGFDDKAKRRDFVKSKVIDKGDLLADVFEVKLASGRSVRCTADHYWFSGRGRSETIETHAQYQKPRVGGTLVSFEDAVEPEWSFEQTVEWAYLAGLIDGEGCISVSSLQITQSEAQNPDVCRRIRECLKTLGLSYAELHESDRKPHKSNDPRFNKATIWTIHGGRTLHRWILRNSKIGKAGRFAKRFWLHPGPYSYEDKIVSITKVSREPVYWIQTESGNYVSQGYLSKNSANYLNDPVGKNGFIPEEWIQFAPRASFPSLKWMRITLDPNSHNAAKRMGDWAAISISGSDKFGKLYVVDLLGSRTWGPTELLDALFDLNEEYEDVPFYIEDEHATFLEKAILMEEDLRSAKAGKRIKLKIHWVGATRNETKYERWSKLYPRFSRRQVIFAQEIDPSIQLELKTELVRGTASRHDDFLDTLAMAETGRRTRHDATGQPIAIQQPDGSHKLQVRPMTFNDIPELRNYLKTN